MYPNPYLTPSTTAPTPSRAGNRCHTPNLAPLPAQISCTTQPAPTGTACWSTTTPTTPSWIPWWHPRNSRRLCRDGDDTTTSQFSCATTTAHPITLYERTFPYHIYDITVTCRCSPSSSLCRISGLERGEGGCWIPLQWLVLRDTLSRV